MNTNVEQSQLPLTILEQDSNVGAEHAELEQIPVDLIDRNIENPRIMFQQSEMNALTDSILQYGVQVPISVYRKGSRYVLIDGERRWICAINLDKELIPALVQEKPDELQNLILMFNIHAAREQWSLFTIALKLREISGLIEKKEIRKPTERDLSTITGLSRSIIHRSQLLLEMPDKYQAMLLDEFKMPKYEQNLTEDFFIEMEKSLKAVTRVMPNAIDDMDRVRDVLIEKFSEGIIEDHEHFRDVGRIARAENVRADPKKARVVLEKLFSKNDLSIKDAYQQSVEEAYNEHYVEKRLSTLLKKLDTIQKEDIDIGLRESIEKFVKEAEHLLDELS